MHESSNRDFYSKDSVTYEATRFTTAAGQDDHNRLMSCLATLSDSLDLTDVVEVGVGTGRVTRVLLAQGAKAVRCVDIAPGMLKVAEETTADPRARYIEGSAYDLPIGDDDCSSFVSVNLLTHLDDLDQFWREASRVLRPGGMALVTSTKVDSLYFPFGVIANRRGLAYGQNVYTVWHRRNAQLGAIARAGGKLESITGHFYTPRAVDKGPVGRVFHVITRLLDRLPSRLRARLAPMDIYLVRF
ncbi:methyltransferase domain-containing protein [Mycolicibacterium sp.]|uniref:class I SAM-dependent methyltransferase n=1 Tax=Mycolicibacterium sp. TaxID=2320850 RepID=UPI003D0AD095